MFPDFDNNDANNDETPEFSDSLRRAIQVAHSFSQQQGHVEFTTIHLFLMLIREKGVGQILKNSGLSPKDRMALMKDVKSYLETNSSNYTGGVEDYNQTDAQGNFKMRMGQNVMQIGMAAQEEVLDHDRSYIHGADLLVQLLKKDGYATKKLKEYDLKIIEILSETNDWLIENGDDQLSPSGEQKPAQGLVPANDTGKPKLKDNFKLAADSNLGKFTDDLVARAKAGKIDPVIGRQKEIDRAIQILGKRTKNSPAFLGEPGVGKTAIAEGIALKIAEGDVPEYMKNARIFSLNMGSLVAGTKYRGDFEERMKGVVEELTAFENDEENPILPILFIDEMHTVIGAGSASGSLDAANILKPAMARGDIHVMGATTHDEYRKYILKDKALKRRFRPIKVGEPTPEEAIEILMGLKSKYEEAHGVTYTDAAIEAIVKLTVEHIPDGELPDKAIDVMDEAGSMMKIFTPGEDASARTIGEGFIETTIADITGIDIGSLKRDEKTTLMNLEDDLKGVIFEQDAAIEALTEAVYEARAGLGDKSKTAGSYLFYGPTGVGKTDLAKQLGEKLGLPVHRFDMSDYMEKHAVSKLIGSPPGYVGYDEGGKLTEAVDRQGKCIVLLDEIEKAHPDVYNLFLQVMDNGALTDSANKVVDFRNVILIMTTNAGSQQLQKNSIGFGETKDEDRQADAGQAVKSMFQPEFLNRLDAMVPFGYLSHGVMRKIVEKELNNLRNNQLAEKKIKLEVSDEAMDYLADKGYSKEYGARPLKRVIKAEIKKQLNREILFNGLDKGGVVSVSFNDESKALSIECTPAPANDEGETKLLAAPKQGAGGPTPG